MKVVFHLQKTGASCGVGLHLIRRLNLIDLSNKWLFRHPHLRHTHTHTTDLELCVRLRLNFFTYLTLF